MDNIAYLNQISSKKKVQKSPLEIIKKFKFLIIGLVSLIIILIIVSKISSALDARETDFTYRLNTRVTNFSEIINSYRSGVKSSDLRTASSTLSSTFTNLTANLPQYYKKTPPKSVKKEETKIKTDVQNTLTDAKINGTLDRTYARQIAYGIKIIILLIDQIEESDKDKELKSLLENTKTSLNTVLPTFSEAAGY